jgi:NAD(P)-dependent dehydrogenase (short-subunit alcohol dehydrogenase family)/uncharacterized membrane protein
VTRTPAAADGRAERRSGDPSAWSVRLPTVGLALIGLLISGYLAAFQLGFVAEPWDPFFGSASSSQVLTSGLSRSFPVPDAALGAAAYAADAVLGLLGGSGRWHRRPWLVLAFGVVVAALAVTGILLTIAQATFIGAWCSLCLASAGLSLLIAYRSADEVAAAVERLRGRRMRRHAPAARPPEGVVSQERPRARRTAAAPSPSTIGREQRPATTSARSRAMSGVVVVTGASAGIGRATVRAFARKGWDVGLIARNEEALQRAAEEVRGEGGRALVLPLDVADAEAVDRAADRVEQELGPIDIWVNDAMVSVFSPVREMRPEEYRRVTEVSYLGYVHGTLAALGRMLPRDRGVIVQVGSALAYRGIPLQSAYCAAKHAIEGFCDSLWAELIHDGSHVRLSMVQMPAVNTPQFDWVKSRLPNRPQPVPPIFQPEVAAEAIVYAAEHPRRELFVGRSTDLAVYADRVVPGVLDWYLGRTGYASQQTDQPEDPGRPDDLWQPLPGDHGAHGRFDDRAASWSAQLWAATHRPVVAAGLATMAGVGVMALRLATGVARRD